MRDPEPETRFADVAGQRIELERRLCDGPCQKPFWVTKDSKQTKARGFCDAVCNTGAVYIGVVSPTHYKRMAERRKHREREPMSVLQKYRDIMQAVLVQLEQARSIGVRISTSRTSVDLGNSPSDLGNAKNRIKVLADGGDAEAKELWTAFEELNSVAGGGKKTLAELPAELRAQLPEVAPVQPKAQEPEPETPVEDIVAAIDTGPCDRCDDEDLMWEPSNNFYRCRACGYCQDRQGRCLHDMAAKVAAAHQPVLEAVDRLKATVQKTNASSQPSPKPLRAVLAIGQITEVPETIEEQIKLYDSVQLLVEAYGGGGDLEAERACRDVGVDLAVYRLCRQTAEHQTKKEAERLREAARPDKTIAWEAAIEKGMEKGIASVAKKLKEDLVAPTVAQAAAPDAQASRLIARIRQEALSDVPSDQVALEAILAALRTIPWRERARILSAAAVFAGVPGAVFLVPKPEGDADA